MSLILTRQQVRAVDQLAVEKLGMVSIVLMENAARNAAEVIEGQMDRRGQNRGQNRGQIAVVCGGGNNGGDGYAIARHLHRLGHEVVLHAAKTPTQLKGDAAINFEICRKLGLTIRDADGAYEGDVVVDAVLGTGFSQGQVRGEIAAVIERINDAGHRSRIVAIDVPSGLDCDSGASAQPTVCADITVTFVAEKTGFSTPAARKYLGEVVVRDIGLPERWVRQVLDL